MPPFTAAGLTMAEILAAEALAATAAAEAAAVTAAEIATAEAATAAATEAATTTAAQTAGATPPAGLEQVAGAPPPTGALPPAGATPPPPAGATPSPAGLEQVAGSTPPPPDPTYGFSQEELNAIQEGQNLATQSGTSPYAPTASTEGTQLVQTNPPPAGAVPSPSNAAGIDYNAGLAETPPGTSGILEVSPDFTPTDDFLGSVRTYPSVPVDPAGVTPKAGTLDLVGESYGVPRDPTAMYAGAEQGIVTPSVLPQTPPPTNSFVDGLKSIGEFASNNKFYTGAGLYLGANALGMFNPKAGSGAPPQKKTFRNPNPLSADFNRNAQTTPNVYQPRTYQEGGITQASRQNNDTEGDINGDVPRYYRGELTTSQGQKGDVYGATQRFLDMYDPASRYTPPAGASDPSVGIFRDTNPSTANESALKAADIRRKALENRAYVKTGANYIPPSREMGELDFTIIGSKDKKNRRSESDSVLAARGGIMQASLGDYAAGGNPRLLRGPGDGMSDNIPAMIGSKQPARLADGEFVVPADVVSHLGNGSTEAGAKRLHEMMNQVRMDRTGKKKQAPAVKAKKYLPK